MTVVEQGPLRWTSAPAAWVLALLVAGIVLWAVSVYRRERGNLSPGARAGLASLRVLALLLPLLALFGPYRERVRKTFEKSRLVVLVDTSASMKTVDRYPPESEQRLDEALRDPGAAGGASRDLSRLDVVKRLLSRADARVLRSLADRFVLHVVAFDEELRSLGTTDPAVAPDALASGAEPADRVAETVARLAEQTPRGARTRIGAALRSVARVFAREDRPLAGVVLLTDGRDNAEERPEDVLATLGKGAEDLHVAAVGLGDPRLAKNLRVDRVIAKDVVLVQDEVGFQAVLRHKGFAGVDGVEVSMSVVRVADGSGDLPEPVEWRPPATRTSVLSRRVRLGGEEESTTAALRAEFGEPGTYEVRIAARLPEPHAREDAVREDDVAVHRLRVMDQRIKVLLADYTLRHESWFLKNLLVRESTHPGDPRRVDAQVFVQSFDPEVEQPHGRELPALRAFPSTRAEVFSYDVVVLGDVVWRELAAPGADREERSKEILSLLREFVAEGGGLALVAGVDRNPSAFLDTPLQDLLPVLVRSSDRGAEPSSSRPFRVAPTEEGRAHPILSVYPDATPEGVDLLWREREGWDWYWLYPTPGGLKPGAYALARVLGGGPELRDERQEPLPVFAAMSYGNGRVFFSAIDQIYRIRREHGDAYYGAFWDEAIRWLATYRLLSGNRRVKIFTDKPSYFVGERATVTVEAYDTDYRPLAGASLPGMQVADPDGRLLVQGPGDLPQADPEAPGVFRKQVPLLQSGTYRIWVDPLDRSSGGRAEHSVEARFATQEDQDTLPDHAVLAAVARRTAGSGPHPPWDLGRVVSDLPERATERVLDRESIPLWDNGWVLLAAVVLLGLEWALRKRLQLA
jgi:hypothetical protein